MDALESVSDEVFIAGVRPDQLPTVASRLTPLLETVVTEQSGYDVSHVFEKLRAGEMQIFVINDFQAVVVTSVQQRPLHKVLWVQFMAGSGMENWLESWLSVQDEYARANGCVAIEFEGRNGWDRMQRKHPEFSKTHVVMRKELA